MQTRYTPMSTKEVLRLDFYYWGGGIMSCDTCPSHERFLRQHLKGLSTRLNIFVPTAFLEETLTEKTAHKPVAAVFATLSSIQEDDSEGNNRQLCAYDRDTEKWKAAATKSGTFDECPICLESYSEKSPREGPLSHPWPTRCTHWACRLCWEKATAHGNTRCPVCREDLTLTLASMLPESPQALALKEADKTLEQMLSTRWSQEVGEKCVRRGTSDGTFSVNDVLKRACKEPTPDWRSLELADPIVAAATTYELVADGVAGCMAIAPGHAILRALSSLNSSDRLRTPMITDQDLLGWSTFTSMIIIEGLRSDLMWRDVGYDIMIGGWHRRRRHYYNVNEDNTDDDDDSEEFLF